MWRTFCVNYEARTQSAPPDKKAKRKLKNYKLKHSRLLTCYSALLYLLVVFRKNQTVTPSDAAEMVALTPTQRLEWLLQQSEISHAAEKVNELINLYEAFLSRTDASEKDLVRVFMDKEQSKQYFESAYKFGDLVFELLHAISGDNLFHRLLVV